MRSEMDLMQTPSLTPEQLQEVRGLVEKLNEKLRAAGSGSAEQAFGIGCGLGAIPALVIITILYIFRLVDLILAAILVVVAALALTGISTMLAIKARSNSRRRVYQNDIEKEISQYLSETELSRPQFDTMAYQILAQGAPLRDFLASESDGEFPSQPIIERQE
jgi:hypothetical protein